MDLCLCQSNSYLSLHNQESLAPLTLFTAIEELIACYKFSLSEVQKLGRARLWRSPTKNWTTKQLISTTLPRSRKPSFNSGTNTVYSSHGTHSLFQVLVQWGRKNGVGRARLERSPTSGAHWWAPAHVEVNDDSQPRRLGTRKSIIQSPSLFFEGGREGGREEEREGRREGVDSHMKRSPGNASRLV